MGVKYYVKTWWKLLWLYAKMDLIWFLRDTKVSLMFMCSDAVLNLASVMGMVLLAERLGPATGFSHGELMFMLSLGLLVNGLYALVFTNNNIGAVSRIIGRGQLDHMLIQPVPLVLNFAASGFAPVTGAGPLVAGLGFALWAAGGVPGGYGLLLRFIPMLILGFLILTAWVYGISALAFWAPYAAEEIAPDVSEMFTSLQGYPLTVLGKAAQFVLCAALPVGAMAWLPARILLGQVNPAAGAGLLAATAAVSVLIATAIFRKGLKHYAKFSSPRYSGFGR